MNENKNNPQLKEVENEISVPHDRKRNWKQFPHSLAFWIFLVLMLAAIIYYIVTLNFAVAP